jgi:protein arginine N-methyltransferase 3
VDDWSDSDEATKAPQDLTAALHRIESLESKYKKVKQDLADYRKLVSERLDIAGLAEADSHPSTSAISRDDDSHYFESYDKNGKIVFLHRSCIL